MKNKYFIEFYRQNKSGEFISLNDGMNLHTKMPVIETIKRVVKRIVERNERGLFSRVNAFRVLKNGKQLIPILTVK